MILPIVQYGHPVLRQKGKPIKSITPEVRVLITDMLETMKAARGVGLAAQQIGRAVQLTVVDVSEITDRPSELWIDDAAVEVTEHMPLILINPEIRGIGDTATGTEGCLSFPEIYAEIERPDCIEVKALNQHGNRVEFRCSGLLARAIQHENDHLQGILFIDRMPKKTKLELQPQLDLLQAETKATLKV